MSNIMDFVPILFLKLLKFHKTQIRFVPNSYTSTSSPIILCVIVCYTLTVSKAKIKIDSEVDYPKFKK